MTTNDDRVKNAKNELNEDVRCGWFSWQPDCLQSCYRYQFALAVMCWFSFIQGFLVHGITPTNTSTLEMRFKLSSTELGWFNSAMELSAAITCIIFCYIADRTNKPRWLMISALLFAIGCFIISLPHFIAEPYNGSTNYNAHTCFNATQQSNRTTGDKCSGMRVSSWLNVLVLGNIILGFGAGIIYTVGVAFIDDFSDTNTSGLRTAIVIFSASVGSTAGFAGGAALLKLDVNFNRPDWPVFRGNKDANPSYVGAWWLGYAIATAAFGTVALVFSCFDFEMPESAAIRRIKRVETHEVFVKVGDDTSGRNKFVAALVRFWGATLRLLVNPVLILLTIAFITHGLMTDGITPFFVKIIRSQFVLSETKAALTLAVLIVVSIGLAELGSGLIMRKTNAGIRSLLLLVLACVTLATFFGIGFLLRCPQEKIVGMTANYTSLEYYDDYNNFDPTTLDSHCNAACSCSSTAYEPVCHAGKAIQYFSPCHAHCRVQQTVKQSGKLINVYKDCDCLLPLFVNNFTSAQEEGLFNAVSTNGFGNNSIRFNALKDEYPGYVEFTANSNNVLIPGVCDSSCRQFYPAMVIMFFILFFGFFMIVPAYQIVMRCVKTEDRSFALAFYTSMQRLLGSIPGPLMVGRMIDNVCIYRETDVCEGDTGACFVYNSRDLAIWIVGVFVGLHIIAIICYILAFILYKPPDGETMKDYFSNFCKTGKKKEEGRNSEVAEMDEVPSTELDE